jgi:hypothetical protein
MNLGYNTKKDRTMAVTGNTTKNIKIPLIR